MSLLPADKVGKFTPEHKKILKTSSARIQAASSIGNDDCRGTKCLHHTLQNNFLSYGENELSLTAIVFCAARN